jgi:hypothetical protein
VLSEVCGAPYLGWVGACGDEVAVAAKRESSRIFIHNGGYESGKCFDSCVQARREGRSRGKDKSDSPKRRVRLYGDLGLLEHV